MNIYDLKKQLSKIKKLKEINNYENYSLQDLQKLPKFNGICELKFNESIFYMVNIYNDDAVSLKYIWRNKYENLSLNIWYKITRKKGYFFDIGAHTGIYSIIGNLNKKQNNIISIEAYYLNYSRLLSNLKINNISTNNCFLAAASNIEDVAKFSVLTPSGYHSAGGKISTKGNLNVSKNKIDNFKLDKKVTGIKIDTEGHEFEVLEGAINYIKKDRPDIILEINKNCFDQCLAFLFSIGYNAYYVDEKNKKIERINRFTNSLIKKEGTNCYLSVNSKQL